MSIEVALQPWDCCSASSAWWWELLHSTPGEIAAYECFVLCKSIGNKLVLSQRFRGFPFSFFFVFLSEKLCRLCSYDVGVLQVFISLRSYCYQKAEQCLLDKAGGEKLRGFTEEVFNRAKNEICAPKQCSPNYWARLKC